MFADDKMKETTPIKHPDTLRETENEENDKAADDRMSQFYSELDRKRDANEQKEEKGKIKKIPEDELNDWQI